MHNTKRKWARIVERKKFAVPFSRDYCECGKRSFFSRNEAERYRMRELQDRRTKKKSHVYECPRSHDYHLTYGGKQ